MSEIVASGIIEKAALVDFAETFHSKVEGKSKPLVQEAKIHLDSDGMHATAVDAANVGMVDATFAPRGFEHYEARGSATLGVNLGSLIDRLGPAGKSDLVEFELDMETRHLKVHYGSANLSIALIDPDSIRQEPTLPAIDLPNEVVLEGKRVNHAVEVVDMVSDHVYFEGRPDDRELVIWGEGDTDDADVTYGDEELIDGSVDEDVGSYFSANYVKALTSPIPDDAEVRLEFGEEFPLKIHWESHDGAMQVSQSLAPRIESK